MYIHTCVCVCVCNMYMFTVCICVYNIYTERGEKGRAQPPSSAELPSLLLALLLALLLNDS